MKLTGVTITPVARPLSRDTQARDHGANGNADCMVELHTDAGVTGIGIGSYCDHAAIEQLTANVLLGQDPRAVTGLWQRMRAAVDKDAHGGRGNKAAAILDVALWDLKAKFNREPLWQTLGGARPRANTHAGAPTLRADDGELVEWYGMMAGKHGVRGAILKVGLEPGADLLRLALMRDALLRATADPVLMIEAGEYWTPEQAVRNVREMEQQFDLTAVQVTTGRGDLPGLKQISTGVSAAVGAGRGMGNLVDFLPYFQHHALDIIEIDIGAMGITGALQLADAAYGYELPVLLTATPGNIHVHLAGAMPYFMSMEVMHPQPGDGVFTTDVGVEDGWSVAGDTPGNGLAIDHAALAHATVTAP